jgi:speckle-type POZ protein
MFFHETLESEKSVIQISDIEFEVLQELIRFVYCGKVSNLETVALDLLAAADKYGFLDLKKICEEYLMENFQVDNSLEILIIADLHDCPKLKSDVVHFIGKNISKIVCSSDWNEFFEKQTKIFNEMLVKWVYMKV